MFTINLGIACGQLLEGGSHLKGQEPLPMSGSGLACCFLADPISGADPRIDDSLLIHEISGVVEREAAPYLDRYLSDDELIALWESGQSPGLTETQRLRYLERSLLRKSVPNEPCWNWVLDGADARARADLGDVLLEFDEDGNLIYGVETDQIIKLRYQIDGDTIITDQPSAPQTERTAFSLSDDRELTLAFGGVPYRFYRWEAAKRHRRW